MSQQVNHFDRGAEPRARYHPHYDTFRSWLDAVAPADQAQKLRNRPKHRRRSGNMSRIYTPTSCHLCHDTIDVRDIVDHMRRHADTSRDDNA